MPQNNLKKAPAKVLIVDDHPAVREALTIRISKLPELAVCGEADDVAEALRLVARKRPDVAVIDISLKTGNGIDLIKRIKARYKNVRMLVWSMYSEEIYAERALHAGALGYITKERAMNQIVEGIRMVAAGKVFLSDEMAEKMLHRAVGGATDDLQSSAINSLSDRELEVFRQIGQGMTTQEIAGLLHLSVKTVETYRDRIRAKLNLSNGAQLSHCASQWTLENG